MKVLVISNKYDPKAKQVASGVDYHRLLTPHRRLEQDYEGYEMSLAITPFHLTPEQLKEFDFCIFSTAMMFENDTFDFHPKRAFGAKDSIEYLQSLGVTVICDLDDTWKVDKNSIHHSLFKKQLFQGRSYTTHVIDSLLHSDLVVTTNNTLKKDIEGLSSSIDVEVIPNAIDSSNPMFSKKKNRSKDFITFGYAKVVTQEEELEFLNEFLAWAYTKPNFRLKFMGYDNGQHHRKVHSILSQKETATTKQYGFMPRVLPSVYGYGYQDLDVLLTPLADKHFNHCKSNLKQIECAFTDTIFLGSNVLPYSASNFGIKFRDMKDLKTYTEQILEDFDGVLKDSIATANNMAKYELKEVNKLRHEMYQSFI